MSYWDTSALVKLYAKEADSAIFEARAAGIASPLVTSQVAFYKACATFHRKEMEGSLQVGGAAILSQRLAQDSMAGNIIFVPVNGDTEREFLSVLRVCYSRTPPLLVRTLDAIHLASALVAAETEMTVTDKRLREAAKALQFSIFPA